MIIDTLADFSWRETLVALAALLAVYVVIVFFRLRRLKPAEPLPEVLSPSTAAAALATYATIQQNETPAAAPSEAGTPPFPWEDAPAPKPALPVLDILEQEVDQLRREVGSLRAEVLLLREAQKKATTRPPLTQTISPVYNEAMQIAQQGGDAAAISRRCSISRAEAELVVSLVRNQGDS